MRKQSAGTHEISDARLKELKADAVRVLSDVRRMMMQRQPFTGAVAMNLDIVPVRDVRLETAATDGKRIFFDIDFLSSLNTEERLFVFAHEVWHNLMMHFARNENRDRRLMNVATDLEVNQLLVKDGFCLPSQALMPSQFNLPPDLAAEEYYERLARRGKDQDLPGGGSGSGGKSSVSGQFDKHVYSGDRCDPDGQEASDKYGKVGTDPDFNPGDPKAGVERIREAAVAASQVMERTRGSLPAHIRSLVQALLKPEISWREQLQQFVTRTCCGENREWNPPNRRHVWQGTYLQSRKGEKIRVFAGLDVSGSTSRDIPKFLSELNGLVRSFGRYELTVAQCDTEVKSCRTYTDDDPLDLENEKFEVEGGGGTALAPLLEKAAEIGEDEGKPDAIVILTDGFCEHFSEDDDPGVPVMWLVTKGGDTGFADFGDMTEFKEAS